MATRALKHRVIIRIGVARRAHAVRISVVDRELGVLCVIKARIQPVRRTVAGLASRREKLWLRGMSRIGGVVVVRLVAADASCRKRGVIVVDVAVGALSRRRCMRPSQRERRRVVIKR